MEYKQLRDDLISEFESYIDNGQGFPSRTSPEKIQISRTQKLKFLKVKGRKEERQFISVNLHVV